MWTRPNLRSATSCARVLRSSPVTVRWRPEEASRAAGEQSQRHRLLSSASLYLQRSREAQALRLPNQL